MLESSGFDFRNRHPQKVLLKLTKRYGLGKESKVARVAYSISLDMYRTFAPLKQTSTSMAFACIELAGRLLDEPLENIQSEEEYSQWHTSRDEVMGMYGTATDFVLLLLPLHPSSLQKANENTFQKQCSISSNSTPTTAVQPQSAQISPLIYSSTSASH